MTEQEWLACADTTPMERFLEGRGWATNRRWRLWACSCIRRIWHLLADQRCRRAVEVAEAFADGAADHRGLKRTYQAARRAWLKLREEMDRSTPDQRALRDALEPRYYGSIAAHAVTEVREHQLFALHATACVAIATEEGVDSTADAVDTERAAQAALLRDIFGNPFRPVTPDPAWRSPQVVALAQAAYDQRELPSGTLDGARLAVLADALEEAGCTNADLLDHLRGPGPHVRGCWVVDLILGKS